MGQVLTYAQQSRERANSEQVLLADRMQEYRRQMERDNQRLFSDADAAPGGDGIQAVGRSSHKMIEAVMQSTPRGKVVVKATQSYSRGCLSFDLSWKLTFLYAFFVFLDTNY